MHFRTIFLLLLLPAAGLWAPADAADYSHQEYFEHYEGTKTCLTCHEQEAEDFFHSQHYQWKGKAPAIVNAEGRLLGKMNTINDFCTNPTANWIEIVHNSRGEVISKGCSACHAGLGTPPSETMSRKQLENIDCLMCHASGYRRNLYPDGEGGFAWKPILWKNQEGLDSVAKRISSPKRLMCLRCHSSSGGGANYKRGDLEWRLRDPEPDYDVHMTSDGPDMRCVTCHAAENHRVRGRGTDLSATDSPEEGPLCTSCHDKPVHKAMVLNVHTEKVYCTTCHIPTFARTDPTDMARDWSEVIYDAEKDTYEAAITLEQDVKPVYRWYNGTTREQFMGEKVRRLPGGEVPIMMPQGERNEPAAKIYPFKLHRAKLPVLSGKDWLIPIVVEGFFADGDMYKAVQDAAAQSYGVKDAEFEWADTVRYMGIFHGIPPASEALSCLDCHTPGGRMDWKVLGYDGDPLEAVLEQNE